MSQWYKLSLINSAPFGVGAFDTQTGSINGAVITGSNIYFQSRWSKSNFEFISSEIICDKIYGIGK